MQRARAWHAVTAAVTIAALVLQLVLVVQGGVVLDETERFGLGERLWHFVSYFTIQSNALVAIAAVQLARTPDLDGRGFRALRLAGLLGISVTGVVHFTLLRPLLDLDGWDYFADKLLHMVVPALAVVGWAIFGPRPRIDRQALVPALAWPLGYLAYVLVAGGLSGWYPYPFLDVDLKGWGEVIASSVGVTALFVVFYGLAWLVDRRAKVAP
jgi:glucose uptake protein GlcU